ncbi:hypothetical protein PG2072B_1025 [Bifidobacterium pseudolongum subsp. globosum]|uniref:Uncharacterized protein n=1 Tax=Bifidobacterium pseudolongum subsp. globosum TaxID=1690 RepID=A0A4Q5BCV1_9BIFI|nr:hypothetical protein [Bifidobacterium pseudolongum]RYQ68422.1 hypothetical protein PG2072B_1025 [Bifidobacterium pseudolongum subsp. globosum]
MTQTETTIQDTETIDLTQAALQLADLKTRKNAIDQQITDLTALILRHTQNGRYETGDLTLTVTAGNRTIDPVKFMTQFPVEQYPEYYELKPKALSKVEKLEGSARIAGCVRQGARRVTVK